VHIDREGETILPNGRLLTPRGRQLTTAPHPFGMALSGDGKVLVTVNGGIEPFSLTVIHGADGASPESRQIPSAVRTDKQAMPSAFVGAAVDTPRRLIYASGGDDGRIAIFSLDAGVPADSISLSTPAQPDAFVTDIALSADGRLLYALDLAHYRMVVVDTVARAVLSSIGVGRNPFALALTRDGRGAYVANMGTFRYSLVETRSGDDPRGLGFPPFGYPSRESREGTVAEGRRVPGLGDPNVEEACSVWAIDLTDPRRPSVMARLKTGLPVGPAIGGSSPAGLVASADTLYVSNATNDSVEAYDLRTHERRWRALLTPERSLEALRGVLPFGLALSPEGARLFVAESGINAVGVLDAKSGEVRGHVPSGWYPSRVAVSPDGKRLYVSNAKGFGAGPNGGRGYAAGPEGTYIGNLMKGTVSLMDMPADSELPALSERVRANNGLVPVREERAEGHPVPLSGRSSRIRHVVLIAKENRTFDEVYGDLPGANGDPSLARFGGTARAVGPHADVTVTPNHRALAERFALSDNFYVDSDVSADGHRWLVGAYANHWVETVTAAGYGKGAQWKRTAPGRLALFESNSSLAPEDYLERGSMWEHLARSGVGFRNYGEGFEFAGIAEDEGTAPTGGRLPVNVPMPAALFAATSREFPGFNMNIPDQYRADVFLKDLRDRYASGRETLPSFLYVFLPNDHGAEAKPQRGYPFLESYVADNDLALGRVVEALSRTRWWREMAIFVTEDDAQSGVDHVDAHRSLCLLISPWARRGHVSRRQASTASIHKTIYRIFGLPPLHLPDGAASDLADLFSSEPDLAPYAALKVDRRLFDPATAGDASDPGYRRARQQPTEMDAAGDARRQLPVQP
jgi:YVTN family beta-propeller protein